MLVNKPHHFHQEAEWQVGMSWQVPFDTDQPHLCCFDPAAVVDGCPKGEHRGREREVGKLKPQRCSAAVLRVTCRHWLRLLLQVAL